MFRNLSFRVTASDGSREEAIKEHQMDSDCLFTPLSGQTLPVE